MEQAATSESQAQAKSDQPKTEKTAKGTSATVGLTQIEDKRTVDGFDSFPNKSLVELADKRGSMKAYNKVKNQWQPETLAWYT